MNAQAKTTLLEQIRARRDWYDEQAKKLEGGPLLLTDSAGMDEVAKELDSVITIIEAHEAEDEAAKKGWAELKARVQRCAAPEGFPNLTDDYYRGLKAAYDAVLIHIAELDPTPKES